MGDGGALFGSVDRAVFAAAFADRLRHAGIDAAFTSIERFTMALDVVGPIDLDDLYWLARLSFVGRHAQIAAFDAVFAAIFDTEAGLLPSSRRGRQQPEGGLDRDRLVRTGRSSMDDSASGGGVPWATLPSIDAAPDRSADAGDESIDDVAIPELRPSSVDSTIDRPFDSLDEAELERVGRMLEASITSFPQRRSRRRRPSHSGGEFAMRRTLRGAMHTGGEVMRLERTTRRRQPRRIVVVLDVSGSMEVYARAYLHLIRPLAVQHRAEVFAFATDLTRITASVRLRSPADAIDHMSAAIGDRFSGTRVATSLRTLLHHRTWSSTVRGAVVVICSDGWDSDDPVELGRMMRRLSLLAHRVIWVNPRAAAVGFEPIAGGMAAALPHCDHFLAGNTARSMQDVIAAVDRGCVHPWREPSARAHTSSLRTANASYTSTNRVVNGDSPKRSTSGSRWSTTTFRSTSSACSRRASGWRTETCPPRRAGSRGVSVARPWSSARSRARPVSVAAFAAIAPMPALGGQARSPPVRRRVRARAACR